MKLSRFAIGLSALVAATLARADEGMWLFSVPPREEIQAKYGFEITDAWLNHLMKSSVRFNSGGSGSFVSADGLVVTNHHVAADAIQKLSSEEHNYLRDGFLAKTQADELKCVDLELNVLQSIEDVTARVNAAIPVGATSEAAAAARRKVMAEIEKESLEKTGLRSDVVTLYQGGAYHLYRFKKYTDVRLVFAPELSVAFFGGDPDNFEYPRYNLDVAFLRVYENGQPVKPANYLKWSKVGAQDGELAFVSGHPGTTRRLLTVPELEYIRDNQYPFQLELLKRREVALLAWSGRSSENARRARDELFGIQNTRKARDGALAALQDPEFFEAKVAAEAAFKKQLKDVKDGAEALAAFDRIAGAQKKIAAIVTRHRFLESGLAFNSESFALARELLRAGIERAKPNGERLKEFTDSRRESFEQELFSDKPIYADLEIVLLSDALSYFVEKFGANDPLVKQVLAGKSPRVRAAELINGTQVRDVAFRRKLYEGGASAVTAAKDPMIELAQLVDDEARALRKIVEEQDEIKQQAQAVIGKARFAVQGTGTYPDATFTLRLSYGPVKGYEENGVQVPSITQLSGLFERSEKQGNKDPFELPAHWHAKKSAFDLTTPANFITTCDIIGGNSGSPTVNTAGEFIGIIFDGNIQSLVSDFGYDDKQSRALSVHSAFIIEALRKAYDATPLVNEILNGRR